ncbi:MAG TPA: SUMF1/EgtB/PvdO family nonheme iron enzyme [Nannocystis sp.]
MRLHLHTFCGLLLALGCREESMTSAESASTETSSGEPSATDSEASTGSGSSSGETSTTSSGAAASSGTTEDVPCTAAGCACTDTCDPGLECTEEGLCAPPGMVWVPEGEFVRGCTLADEPHCDEDEGPRMNIYVSGFAIDRTEVTEAAFEECVQAGNCVAPSCTKGIGELPYAPVSRGDWPVDCVSWDQAAAFCAWAGKRLPTEAEWEKAARGVDGRRFTWGNAPEPTCEYVVMDENKKGCDTGDRWAVGSKPLDNSPYGALDMLGNVSEWVSDWYGEYDPKATTDPVGPPNGTYRVMRGGSFVSPDSVSLRTTFRSGGTPETTLSGIGFRCAWSA